MTSKEYWSEYDFTKIPFDDIVQVGQRSLLDSDLFSVSWILGRFCNYNCSYCWPHGRSDDKDHRSTELCVNTIDEIKRQARENLFNSFHFSFSGGEPTLHPGYVDILEHLGKDVSNTNYTSVHMTTNLSPGLKWMEKYAKAVTPFHRASVTSSFHTEFADKDKFIEKIIFLQEWDIQVTINMVMVPEWFEKDWDNAMYFHEKGINVTLKPQSNSNATAIVEGYTDDMLERLQNGMPQRDYTSERQKTTGKKVFRPKKKQTTSQYLQKYDKDAVPPIMQVRLTDSKGEDWYLDQAERFNAFEFNKFEGWSCEAGYRSIIIREPCGSIKRSYSCRDVPLGNIETGFELFKYPKACITPSCVSSADSKIPKYKLTGYKQS